MALPAWLPWRPWRVGGLVWQCSWRDCWGWLLDALIVLMVFVVWHLF